MANNQFTFKSDIERFMSYVEQITESGCWLWLGPLENGYGRFQINGKQIRMPRAAWLVLRGPIPAGLEPDHLCRVRCCVNPDHMELVTHLENVRRGKAGKRMLERTHCPKGHPYAGENLIIRTTGARRCRECSRLSDEERRRKRGVLVGTGTGGWERAITHCPQGHEYTPDNTYVHKGSRHCKTCTETRAKARRLLNRKA